MKNLSDTARKLLCDFTEIDGCSLKITKELDRADYLSLDDTLGRIGGKWNSRKKCHIFPCSPTSLVEKLLKTNLLPDTNPTAFFPTPLVGIEEMWSMCDESYFQYCASSDSNSGFVRVLEPSGGVGAIADFLKTKGENVDLVIVELLKENQDILKGKGYSPVCGSFLDYPIPEKEEQKFDFVFMNPPFSVKGDKYAFMTHIYHAMKMLKTNGELIAIVPTGWISGNTKKEEAFRNLVSEQGGELSTLPRGTFKESGTNIETKVIKLLPKRHSENDGGSHYNKHEYEFRLYAMQSQSNDKYFISLAKKIASGGITEEELSNELREFSYELIRKYAMGDFSDKYYHISGDIFITTKYIDSYVTILIEYCKEYSKEYSSDVELRPSDSFQSDKKCAFPLPNSKRTDRTLPESEQLKIISNGGGLEELLYA